MTLPFPVPAGGSALFDRPLPFRFDDLLFFGQRQFSSRHVFGDRCAGGDRRADRQGTDRHPEIGRGEGEFRKARVGARDLDAGGVRLLVWRHGIDVVWQPLSAADATLIVALLNRHAFADACAAALTEDPLLSDKDR